MQNIAILKAFCLPAGFAKLFSAWGDRKYWILVCLGGDQYPDRYYIDITLSFEKHWVLQKDIPHWATPHTLFNMNCQNFGCTIKWHIQNPIKHLRWSVFLKKKNSYRLKQLSTKSRKCSILDVSQGSEYASAITFQTNKKNNS